MPSELNALLWLVILIALQLVLVRLLHRQIQLIFFFITHRAEIAYVMFSLFFFPGVLLHECSHYLMARLLRVPTGKLMLFPKPLEDGKLQLGYLETLPTDWLRDSLIGAAPLISGGCCVMYIGLDRLGLKGLLEIHQTGWWDSIVGILPDIFYKSDSLLWFYLAFVISSTMLPSASDRRAWLPLGLVFSGSAVISLLAGAGPWMLQHLAPLINQALLAMATVFAISVFVYLIILPPLLGIRYLINWLIVRK
jgi:hypothetical protein